MLNIGNRLHELRMSKKLQQEQVADKLGVTKAAISAYETGIRQPPYDILIAFAKMFHVSTDYLLGVSDIRTLDITGLTEPEISILSELVHVMAEKNKKLNRR